MKSVHDIAKEIVDREGGYVNDPDDLGGATKYGVTIGTLKKLGLDKTGDGRVTNSDLRAVTRADAREIFVTHYFERPGLALLPEPIQASVFDMYVNAGNNAVKILQRLLNDMGHTVVVDGVVGPQTESAAELANANAPHHLVDAYGIARRNYYYSIADNRPANRKFALRKDGGKGGWIQRAEAFISRRYHLSPEEHIKRVSAWV